MASHAGDDGPLATDQPPPNNDTLWKRFKRKLLQGTRKGRREAAQAQIQAERERALAMDPTPFNVRAIELADLVEPKDIEGLHALGGTEGLSRALGVDLRVGLNLGSSEGADVEGTAPSDEHVLGPEYVHASLADRQRVYGTNQLISRKGKTLWLLMLLALQDRTLILLSVAAIISLALGLYTDFGAAPEILPCSNPPEGMTGCPAPDVDWVEGVAIVIAIAVVVGVSSLNDWQKERKFRQLDAEKDRRDIKLLRHGCPQLVPVEEVVVGDILLIEPGEIVACDAVFLRGHNVRCDESGATGESDMVRKASFDECWADHLAQDEKGKAKRDCFLLSGSKVLEGVGECLVIAVGPESFNGKLLMSLHAENEETPLQVQLNGLAEKIALFGSIAGGLLFFALLIRFFVELGQYPDRTSQEKGQAFIQILILAVTLIVVAVPEGLPLAVTLALAYATKRMFQKNLLVRTLSACETAANAQVICTDKTGTLTQNWMHVVKGSIGLDVQFATGPRATDAEVKSDDLGALLSPEMVTLLNDSITINSTAFEEEPEVFAEGTATRAKVKDAKQASWANRLFHALMPAAPSMAHDVKSDPKYDTFVGNKTETAMLTLARSLGWEDYRIARSKYKVVQVVPFASERKAMAVVIELPDGKGYRLLVKGASEVLLGASTTYIDSSHSTLPISLDNRTELERTITNWASQSLRTIALAYRDFEIWPPPKAPMNTGNEVAYEWLAQDLTWLALMGIEDPLRAGVSDAVATCQRAGVSVKMCTGDNMLTARSIAEQCGILTPGGLVIEGPTFRKLSPTELAETVPRLQVLARSSPQDKQLLVETLKSLNQIVGVTGDGTNDGPALKAAHIGFSMGLAGTEVAKEASDIILLDDNFSSIVNAIMWGRCVNDAVRKFIQFQLSVNIAAVGVTFITAVVNNKSNLTAVQLLYCNLCLDVFAALALATDPASPALLDRQPAATTDPLISGQMWLLIATQSAYQVITSLVLSFAGKAILNFHSDPDDLITASHHDTLISTIVFNTFIWILLFNEFNARRLDRKLNVWEGMWHNPWFLVIVAFEAGIQVLIIYVGGAAFSVTRLEGKYWAISIVIGILTIPLAALIKLFVPTPVLAAYTDRVIEWLNGYWVRCKGLWTRHGTRARHDPHDPEGTGSKRSQIQRQRTWDILADDPNQHTDFYAHASPALSAMARQLRLFQNVRGPRVAAQVGSPAPSRANTQMSLPLPIVTVPSPAATEEKKEEKWHGLGALFYHPRQDKELHAQSIMALAPALTCAVPAWIGAGQPSEEPLPTHEEVDTVQLSSPVSTRSSAPDQGGAEEPESPAPTYNSCPDASPEEPIIDPNQAPTGPTTASEHQPNPTTDAPTTPTLTSNNKGPHLST